MSDGISFNSKIDLWLLVVLLLGVTVCLLVALRIFAAGDIGGQLVASILLITGALLLWLIVATRYVLSDEKLHIRCGPFKWTVPIRDITAVTPTRNPLSSPALSLDRLRIDYGNGRSIMISPEPRQEFLRQLQARRA